MNLYKVKVSTWIQVKARSAFEAEHKEGIMVSVNGYPADEIILEDAEAIFIDIDSD